MSKRVLICEDDRAIQLLLGKLLTRHGLLPDCVGTGADAVERLRQQRYDLILLDLVVPRMTGYEVVDLLRRERPDFLPRIIVITAQQRAVREMFPVAAILLKPFDLEEFDRVIERVLARSSMRDRDDERRRAERGLRS